MAGCRPARSNYDKPEIPGRGSTRRSATRGEEDPGRGRLRQGQAARRSSSSTTPTTTTSEIAIAIASMWDEKLGVKTKLRNQEWKVYLDMGAQEAVPSRARRLDRRLQRSLDSFLELLQAATSASRTRRATPTRITTSCCATRPPTTDLGARAKLLAEAEKIMIEDMPIVPIFHLLPAAMVKPHVQGWRTTSRTSIRRAGCRSRSEDTAPLAAERRRWRHPYGA